MREKCISFIQLVGGAQQQVGVDMCLVILALHIKLRGKYFVLH